MANNNGHTVPFEASPRRSREMNKKPVLHKANDTNEHSTFDADNMKMNNILGKKSRRPENKK